MSDVDSPPRPDHSAAQSPPPRAGAWGRPPGRFLRHALVGFPALLAAAVLACEAPREPAAPAAEPRADVLYTNGVIWTGVEGAPDASVLAVENGLITHVGTAATVDVSAQETIDLEGCFLMPGFIDNHVHFLGGGAALASVDLRDAASPEELSRRLAEHAATLRAGRWILEGNWDHERWGGELPRRGWIDDGTPETPVFVSRLDGHMALANSVALELAGVTAETRSPAGGEIVRDEAGEPTGVLKDKAMDLVLAVIPPPTEEELLAAFRLAQDHALSLGLTQVHAMTASANETRMLDAFRLARERGLLRIRIEAFVPLEHWQDLQELVAREGTGDDRLRWGGLKGFVDGSLGSSTAWFYQPYSDQPGSSGFPLSDPEELWTLIGDADAAGRRLAVHAIGDRAIDALVGALRETAGAGVAARRYRIEHFQHPTRDAIEALAEAGIIASMQPYHAIDDGRWAEKRIGPERIRTTYAFRSILDAGGILTFGSDWPVAPLSPLEGVYAAVTRRTIDDRHPDGWQPQEKITVEEALRAYTAANAYAGFEEELAGTLEPGKRADLVVLTEDPRAVDPVAIREIGVLETVIGGETVFRAGDGEESDR